MHDLKEVRKEEWQRIRREVRAQADISKTFGPSKSGKTTIIASTEGNIGVPTREDVRVGLNIYKSRT